MGYHQSFFYFHCCSEAGWNIRILHHPVILENQKRRQTLRIGEMYGHSTIQYSLKIRNKDMEYRKSLPSSCMYSVSLNKVCWIFAIHYFQKTSFGDMRYCKSILCFYRHCIEPGLMREIPVTGTIRKPILGTWGIINPSFVFTVIVKLGEMSGYSIIQ